MKKLLLIFILSIAFFSFTAPVSAQPSGGDGPSVKIIKLNFAPVYETASVLTAMKGPDGKVIANEEAKSVVLMDTPDRIRAMEEVIRQMDIQTVTAGIPLKFSRASEVLDVVRPLLTQSVGAVTVNSGNNTITVTDAPAVVERVRRLVETMDPRGRKIILEAKLVHIVLDDEHLDGVDWSGIVADHQNFRLEGNHPFLGGKAGGESLSLGTIEGPDFVPLIEALDTVGSVKEYPVVDVPVMSGSSVRMTIRFDEPDVFLEAVAEDAGDILFLGGAALEFMLKPQVDIDGTLKTLIATREPPAASVPPRAPILTRKPHSVLVRSLEGGSIVVGGLIATEQVLTQRKIPLMGDLPLLGFAFRYHNNAIRREEFIILLTPKSLTPDDPGAVARDVEAPVH